MEFGSGILDAEAPVDAGLSFVSLQFQGVDLPAEGFLVRETLPEATAGPISTNEVPAGRSHS